MTQTPVHDPAAMKQQGQKHSTGLSLSWLDQVTSQLSTTVLPCTHSHRGAGGAQAGLAGVTPSHCWALAGVGTPPWPQSLPASTAGPAQPGRQDGTELPCRARGERMGSGHVSAARGWHSASSATAPSHPRGSTGHLHPPEAEDRAGRVRLPEGEEGRGGCRSFIKSQETAAIKCKVQQSRLSAH